jgi:hypothetical protein
MDTLETTERGSIKTGQVVRGLEAFTFLLVSRSDDQWQIEIFAEDEALCGEIGPLDEADAYTLFKVLMRLAAS